MLQHRAPAHHHGIDQCQDHLQRQPSQPGASTEQARKRRRPPRDKSQCQCREHHRAPHALERIAGEHDGHSADRQGCQCRRPEIDLPETRLINAERVVLVRGLTAAPQGPCRHHENRQHGKHLCPHETECVQQMPRKRIGVPQAIAQIVQCGPAIPHLPQQIGRHHHRRSQSTGRQFCCAKRLPHRLSQQGKAAQNQIEQGRAVLGQGAGPQNHPERSPQPDATSTHSQPRQCKRHRPQRRLHDVVVELRDQQVEVQLGGGEVHANEAGSLVKKLSGQHPQCRQAAQHHQGTEDEYRPQAAAQQEGRGRSEPW